jgi:hypothetical protein
LIELSLQYREEGHTNTEDLTILLQKLL